MRSVNQTVKALTALAIALRENERRTTDKERESLTKAVFCAVMQSERMPANGNNERKVDADPISNR
jgi:hypothetical protein